MVLHIQGAFFIRNCIYSLLLRKAVKLIMLIDPHNLERVNTTPPFSSIQRFGFRFYSDGLH